MYRLLAFLLLIILSPIFLWVCFLILIFSGMPIFFIQDRIGKEKQVFATYKFRTMTDGKITFIGRWLRLTGIDEIPQLLNIIKGDMSFIGPRPLTSFDIKRLNWDNSFHEKRWSVKPGIIGLAQLSPICHAKMSWFYDNYYQENKSIWLDCKIFLATGLIVFLGKTKVKNLIKRKK